MGKRKEGEKGIVKCGNVRAGIGEIGLFRAKKGTSRWRDSHTSS